MHTGGRDRDDSTRLLCTLTMGFATVLAAVMLVCLLGGARWHVLTASYQIYLIGLFGGGLLTATLALAIHEGTWASRIAVAVTFGGILMCGATQVFFFHLLGGGRYLARLLSLLEQVWG